MAAHHVAHAAGKRGGDLVGHGQGHGMDGGIAHQHHPGDGGHRAARTGEPGHEARGAADDRPALPAQPEGAALAARFGRTQGAGTCKDDDDRQDHDQRPGIDAGIDQRTGRSTDEAAQGKGHGLHKTVVPVLVIEPCPHEARADEGGQRRPHGRVRLQTAHEDEHRRHQDAAHPGQPHKKAHQQTYQQNNDHHDPRMCKNRCGTLAAPSMPYSPFWPCWQDTARMLRGCVPSLLRGSKYVASVHHKKAIDSFY